MDIPCPRSWCITSHDARRTSFSRNQRQVESYELRTTYQHGGQMRIGIDLDDTITEMPWFFEPLIKALIDSHQIHIISYRDTLQEVQDELRKHGIDVFTKIWVPSKDELEAKGHSMGTWKGKVAREIPLDVMIDDSPEVLSEMPSTVKRLWLCDSSIFNLKSCICALRADIRIEIIQ